MRKAIRVLYRGPHKYGTQKVTRLQTTSSNTNRVSGRITRRVS